MEPGTDFDSERSDFVDYRAGAADAARGTVEEREETVASGAELTTAKVLEISPDDAVAAVEHIAPAAIAKGCSLLGRADDIGEENRGEPRVGGNWRP
jgi:hypothetical protein